MNEAILGISAYYHDSATALVIGNEIIAAAQEERFSRKKNDSDFPIKAIKSVLDIAGRDLDTLDAIAFYEKPYIKFERLLETYHSFAPSGLKSFLKAMPVWTKEKLFMKRMITDELESMGYVKEIPLLFPEHHLSHCASAFYPSPFEESAILTVDGVGEWATSTISHGKGNEIEIIKELEFPHSIGLLYSAFTYYCGFQVNEGEYKLMGLAPYGNPNDVETTRFIKLIKDNLVDIREDGSILMNMDYFDYATGLTMTNNAKWTQLFGFAPRKPESPIQKEHTNLAFAIQKVTEEILLKLARTARELTGSKNLAMAGGVALNSVANGLIYKSGIFDRIWIQPAAGDAGGALGAALAANYIYFENRRETGSGKDKMKASLLGPEFSDNEIKKVLNRKNVIYHFIPDKKEIFERAAEAIAQGMVVGWFQGRMEYGPRALGSRSFLGDPRNPEMQQKLNLKVKFRESFRPFAPAVLEEETANYFDIDINSPYMLLVVPVKESIRDPLPDNYENLEMMQRLYHIRSEIPAVTHLDYSARIQTVNKEDNPDFYGLIDVFKQKTGCPVIINTSFNIRGEPIVCSPLDAYNSFMKTETDCLVLGNFIIYKAEQQPNK